MFMGEKIEHFILNHYFCLGLVNNCGMEMFLVAIFNSLNIKFGLGYFAWMWNIIFIMLKNNQKRFRVFANVGPNVFFFVQFHEVGAMAIIHKRT
jgi:hypothetical protein